MLKIASINIQTSIFLDRVEVFLKAQQLDVICLQEVLEKDVPFLADICGGNFYWYPMLRHKTGHILGLAVGSPHASLRIVGTHYYVGNQGDPLPMPIRTPSGNLEPDSYHRLLLNAEIELEGQKLLIASTHATWTENGEATPRQLSDLQKMMQGIDLSQPTVLLGDFNAPRGRDSWNVMASQMTDNIPEHYMSSLDPVLHRAGHLQRMVDGFFTTDKLVAKNVQLHQGVSDHCAVTGEIELVKR